MLDVNLRITVPIPLEARLKCAPGELLAVLGPSGTGKSTLLKTIAGLLGGATGDVRVGESVWLDSGAGIEVPAHRRRVGFVFQSYALFPHMTVLQNVMAAADGSATEREAAARRVLASVNMSELERRKPSQLSGGEQQRVGLARALAREPEVLLLDEPFSAVDQATRERLYDELAELRAKLSIPTVLVTHSIPEAHLLADTMVVLHRGRTLQEGTPASVYRHPAEADVARLMGQKNVFDAVVVSSNASDHCELDWGGLHLTTATPAANGSAVTFCVAADDVRVSTHDAMDAPNRLKALVERATSDGSSITAYARLSNGKTLAVSTSQHTVDRRGVHVGSEVWLSIAPKTIHLMPPASKP